MSQVLLCLARLTRPARTLPFSSSLVILLLLSCAAASQASPKDIRVTAEKVNLRSGPGERDDVVGQASRGDFLTTREGRKGEWIEVAAPDSISGWVYGELVNDGVIAVSRLRVRSGPGINYAPIARLDQGDRVTVRGRKGDWLQIAPPLESSLWVHERFVSEIGKSTKRKRNGVAKTTPAQGTTIKAEAGKTVAPTTGAARKLTPAIGPRLKAWRAARRAESRHEGTGRKEARFSKPDDALTLSAEVSAQQERRPPPGATVSSYAAGRSVAYSGTVRPMGMSIWRRPSPYRLVRYDRRSVAMTICFLKGNETTLGAQAGQSVRVMGKEFRVRGVKHPVVVVESIAVVTGQ